MRRMTLILGCDATGIADCADLQLSTSSSISPRGCVKWLHSW